MLKKYSGESTTINTKRIEAILHLCLMDDEEFKKVKTDTQLNLVNGQTSVKDAYEKNYGQKIKIYWFYLIILMDTMAHIVCI